MGFRPAPHPPIRPRGHDRNPRIRRSEGSHHTAERPGPARGRPGPPERRGPAAGGDRRARAYAFVFSFCISSISSSDSRPGVLMSNFVIAKRNTA